LVYSHVCKKKKKNSLAFISTKGTGKEKKTTERKTKKTISVTAQCLSQTFLKFYLCFSFFKASVTHMGG
jgi:hypothetical protein